MDEKKPAELTELLDVLDQVPDKYHAEVARALTHDAGVMERTIRMVAAKERKCLYANCN